MAPMAGLRRIVEHVIGDKDHVARRLSVRSTSPSPLPPHLTALTAQHLKEYTSRGVVVIRPEHQGAAIDHAAIWEKMNALQSKGKMPAIGYYDHFPELAELISGRSAPGLVKTMDAILGEDWAFQPFIHSAFFKNGEGGEQVSQFILIFSFRFDVLLTRVVNRAGTKMTTPRIMPARCATTARSRPSSFTVRVTPQQPARARLLTRGGDGEGLCAARA
jgi:hypothetical protein